MADDHIEQLVLASQEGNADAFGQVYDAFVNQIYRYLHFRVGREDAEDLTELVFLKSWENIRQYRQGKYSFSAWLFRIAHNVVVDHYRAMRHTDELPDEVVDTRRSADAEIMAHQRFDREALSASMAELTDPYRQVLILKYMNEMTNEEIGFVMGKSQAAIRILQFRALRSLRSILERMGITSLE